MVTDKLRRIKEELKGITPEDITKDDYFELIKDIKKEIERILKKARSEESNKIKRIEKQIPISFQGMFFKQDILTRFTDFSEKDVDKAIKNLLKENRIKKIGINFYTSKKEFYEPTIRLPTGIEQIRKAFIDEGMVFLITGLGILQEYVNLLPKRVIHLIYVIRGTGETSRDLIEKRFNRTCSLNPTRQEIRNLMQHYETDIIIIREVGESSIEYHKEGIARIEKAIVDLYFETTRKRIPFDESELVYILKNVLTSTKIDYTRLLRAAERRNIGPEFIRILHELNINLPNQKIEEFANERIEKIIRMLK